MENKTWGAVADIFQPADILLPQAPFRERFAVVACDQYTSQPDYWRAVERAVGEAPSALHLTLPEIYLEGAQVEGRIAAINQKMEQYQRDGVFTQVTNSYIYVERTLRTGKVRRGLVGKIDLAAYEYKKGARSPVRATEATVLERIPPRVAVRKNASLETPHVMLLIDDPADRVLGPLAAKKENLPELYRFGLMMDSGAVAGYQVTGPEAKALAAALETLGGPDVSKQKYGVAAPPLIFAVGDGNHSLATAKACYEALCEKYGAAAMEKHPARYALVEVVNLHDPSLEFEPVHRVLFGIDRTHLDSHLRAALQTEGAAGPQGFELVRAGKAEALRVGAPTSNMVVGSLQNFLDEYQMEYGGRCDYIHGSEVVYALSQQAGTLGFLLPPIEKGELFKTVLLDGALTRKTFSMGNACDKRFYLECRKIVP